jgi:hypothetical protein
MLLLSTEPHFFQYVRVIMQLKWSAAVSETYMLENES